MSCAFGRLFTMEISRKRSVARQRAVGRVTELEKSRTNFLGFRTAEEERGTATSRVFVIAVSHDTST